MKTPLRGEMLRGADFIIGVVSAGGSDPLQTVSCHGARPTNDFVHESAAAVHGSNISGDRETRSPGNSDAQRVPTVALVRETLDAHALVRRTLQTKRLH